MRRVAQFALDQKVSTAPHLVSSSSYSSK
jgi:hypothetical protein